MKQQAKGEMKMLTIERKNIILKMVDENASVTVNELTQVLGVSEVTIRKMLNDLNKQGLLRRTRGGAVSLHMAVREADEKEKEKTNIREKKAIAKIAYDMINDSDTVFLDAGSTTLELVKLIRNGNKRDITVVTNALNIAYELVASYDIQVVIIGGQLRHKIMSCVGGITENTLANMYFDKVFLGSNSVNLERGVTTPNLYESQVKQSMLKSGKKTILICDSSKFGLTTMAKICSLDAFTAVITDWNLGNKEQKKILDAGINIIVAEEEKKEVEQIE